jgi:tRNA1Val (adenine37-N6)-methyltransferase
MFRFKHFEVSHGRSSMKVGTDAIILGSWLAMPPGCRFILDVGAGSGVIALMLAQRSDALIHAIDIDEASVTEAAFNFNHSPWKNRLKAIHCSLEKYVPPDGVKYDLIVSNPPFFRNSLLPQSQRLQMAKHNFSLSATEFIENLRRLLSGDGQWAAILPVEAADHLLHFASEYGFNLSRKLHIFPKAGKPQNRTILLFDNHKNQFQVTESLTIRDENGNYSVAYKNLTRSYHAPGYI